MTGSTYGQNLFDNLPKLRNQKEERENIAEKSKIELMDILLREEKLCKNKKFLQKLPDKGAKIVAFYEQVKAEIQRRDCQETLCGELAKLSVDGNQSALDRLEWTGDYRTDTQNVPVEEDDTDPFRILATHCGTEVSKQKITKCEERTEIQSPNSDDLPKVDVYAKELCQRFDSSSRSTTIKKFYTHKPLKNRTSVQDPTKDEFAKDSTTSLPNSCPKNPSNEVKVLSLLESIKVQHQQNKILKDLEFRSAVEKLRSKINVECRSPPLVYEGYREYANLDSEDELNSSTSHEESDLEDD